MSEREFLTVREVAELAGVDHKAVRRAIDRGELHAERLFNRLRIPVAEWERYRAQQRVTAKPRRAQVAPPRRQRVSSVPGSLDRLTAIEGGGRG